MKNKELLNICYKFFNRYINSSELIEMLNNIDKKTLSKEEIKEIDNLINNIKEKIKDIPNKEDEYAIKKKEQIKDLIEKFKTIPNDSSYNDFFNERVISLKKEYEKEIDSNDRWLSVFYCINQNEYFNKCFDNLTDYELLEFIAQNIKAPFPPKLNQEEFERLVKAGIDKDEREWLWRLAFNYEDKNINFDSIVGYYIKVKDGYFITELICSNWKSLNIDQIIDKINDNDLIKDLEKRKSVIESYVTEEQFNKLISKLN